MSTFADVQKLDAQKLRYALMDLAKEIPDAIALGRGDPDLSTPAFIVEAAEKPRVVRSVWRPWRACRRCARLSPSTPRATTV